MKKLAPNVVDLFYPIRKRVCRSLLSAFSIVEKKAEYLANRCAFLSADKTRQKEVIEEARHYFMTGKAVVENAESIQNGLESLRRAISECEGKNAIYRDGILELYRLFLNGNYEDFAKVFARFGLESEKIINKKGEQNEPAR